MPLFGSNRHDRTPNPAHELLRENMVLRADRECRCATFSRDSAFNQVIGMHERADIVVPQEAADRRQILRGELRSADVRIQGILAQLSKLSPHTKNASIFLYPTLDEAKILLVARSPFSFDGSMTMDGRQYALSLERDLAELRKRDDILRDALLHAVFWQSCGSSDQE